MTPASAGTTVPPFFSTLTTEDDPRERGDDQSLIVSDLIGQG